MKNLIALSLVAILAGCVVAPVPHGRVAVQPSVEIVYQWDPVTVRYYYVERGQRRYMPRDWKHEGKHDNGKHRGHYKYRD